MTGVQTCALPISSAPSLPSHPVPQREQREVLRLEEKRELSQKLQGQENRRRLLDNSLRLKMKRLARDFLTYNLHLTLGGWKRNSCC